MSQTKHSATINDVTVSGWSYSGKGAAGTIKIGSEEIRYRSDEELRDIRYAIKRVLDTLDAERKAWDRANKAYRRAHPVK